ncbi:hypothetical protein EZV62_002076 [Acer yangbiense]|uniref:Uncharacterized protein n=1 Tax=Acer yangbiense TaxID=1000413 RepID=A0A5C7IW09_9ROSI|nr:hypothetical protein EZV62_002076 [Acer yangbiense]
MLQTRNICLAVALFIFLKAMACFTPYNYLKAMQFTLADMCIEVFDIRFQSLDRSNKYIEIIWFGQHHLAFFASKLVALGESDLPYILDLKQEGDIETLRRWDFDKNLFANMTAHPKSDMNTNETFAFKFIAICPQTQLVVVPQNVMLEKGMPMVCDPSKVLRIGIIVRYAKSDAEMRWFDVPRFLGSMQYMSSMLGKMETMSLAMTGQRKHDSGSQKRKAKERRDMVIQSFTGSMDSLHENDNAHDLNENEHVDGLNENIDDLNDNIEDLNDLNENEHVDGLNENIDDLNDNIEDLI